jgi:transcriptional regulator with XRE-family HTH domain
MSFTLKTVQQVQMEIASRFKARRLSLNLTQKELSDRSGVAWATLKKFERHGLISLESLLMLAIVLDCLSDFDSIAAHDHPTSLPVTLDSILSSPKVRKRASSRREPSR